MPKDCPSSDELSHFSRGKLPNEENRSVEEHLKTRLVHSETVSRSELPLGLRDRQIGHDTSQEGNIQPQISDLSEGDSVEDFLLLRQLGKGSFARVFLAEQKSLQRHVALKISTKPSDEAQILSQLNHPHIVRVYDERVMVDRGWYLLYMQYVEGTSLDGVIHRIQSIEPERRNGRTLLDAIAAQLESGGERRIRATNSFLDQSDWPATVCWIGARLADALRYAHNHDRCVFHRDVKPGNVLLTMDGLPMLADFNLSYGVRISGAFARDHFGGSLVYMSPEQLEVLLGKRDASDIKEVDDVYSLCVLLWELLTGERPFGAERTCQSEADIRGMIERRRQALPWSQLPESCPRGLRQLLGQCLAADRTERCSDAAKVVDRLQLCTDSRVLDVALPPAESWRTRCARAPVTTLCLCGLVPNLAVGVLNMIYNMNFSGVNRETHWDASMLVNSIVFPAGIGVLLWYSLPPAGIISALAHGSASSAQQIMAARKRCLSLGSIFWGVILVLWAITGIVYPLWDIQFGRSPKVSQLGFIAQFFTFQLLHGVLASSVTFLAVTLVATRSFFPFLMRDGHATEARGRLKRLDSLIDWHAAILGLTPPCALVALGVFNKEGSQLLLLNFGIFGALGFGLALVTAPRIRSTIQLLEIALTPTAHLLYGKPISRESA